MKNDIFSFIKKKKKTALADILEEFRKDIAEMDIIDIVKDLEREKKIIRKNNIIMPAEESKKQTKEHPFFKTIHDLMRDKKRVHVKIPSTGEEYEGHLIAYSQPHLNIIIETDTGRVIIRTPDWILREIKE